MAPTLADPLIGAVVDGRYEVSRRIARGGMATVYLATDLRLDRDVALKVMHPHVAEGADVAARFRREARAAARLAHPGVVSVYDQGAHGEISYLTMEYVPGRTLRSVLTSRGALPLGEALTIAEAVLDALAAAHRAGLIHRDIKPENVLVTPDGRIKVADFGLARAVTEATAATTGTLLGTVAYLAPEIVTSGHADARADVYAVGILLYEMIVGSTPHAGTTPIQIAYLHVNTDVPSPSEAVRWLPIEIDELVTAMTSRDLSERIADGASALEQVRRARVPLDERTLTLRADVEPASGDRRASPDAPTTAVREHVTSAFDDASEPQTATLDSIPIGVPAAAVGGAVGEVVVESSPGRSDRPAHTSRRRRWPRVLAWLLVLVLALAGAAGWYLLWGPGGHVEVPPVAELSEEEAQALLAERSLEWSGSTSNHDRIAEGSVIESIPAAGSSVRRGETVELVVSLGVLMRTVPEVVGGSEIEALDALATALIDDVVVDRVPDRHIARHEVLGIDAEEGSEIPHHQQVRLTVSDGPMVVAVEDHTGRDGDSAIQALRSALDVEPTITRVHSEDVPEGRVISQSLAAGDHRQGAAVDVVVSLGPELFEVPNVVGHGYSSAVQELESRGFVVARENALGGILGWVHSQDVDPGALRPRGTVITLTVV